MAYVIKLKMKKGPIVVDGLTAKTHVCDLLKLMSELASIEPSRISALTGFPPKRINLQCLFSTLEDIGINSGDTLIIEENEKDAPDFKPSNAPTLKFEHRMAKLGTKGTVNKQIIPGDNSCLFTSVAFAMNGYIDVRSGPFMRKLIANAVANQPEKYSAAMLGKPNEEYCSWILKPDSWGGGIELAVLADFFKFEIAVVNIVSSNISTFGEENNYTLRAYLLFDGVHYDALFLQPYEAQNTVKTMFSPADDGMLEMVKLFVSRGRKHRQYTDMRTFTVQCTQCGAGLTGEREAVSHAKTTGHTQFGEVNLRK